MEFKGATIWLRQTIESAIFFSKPDKWFKIWFFLINKVNHKDTKLFKRGTNFTTYEEIGRFTGANKNVTDHFIRWAKKEQMLATRKTTRGMVINVLRYNEYQDSIKRKSDTESELKAKQKRNRSDTINKNDKNDKKYIPEINSGNPTSESSSSPLEVKENKDIGWVIHAFKEINPTMVAEFYKRKPQREAARDLIRTFGLEATLTLIDNYKKVRHKEFCPSISSPLELKTKYSKFNDFYSSPNNK